jgi:outer membrane biosynthesis protein TonB
VKRLVDEHQPAFSRLTELVSCAEREAPSPFAKRAVEARIARALESGAGRPRSRAVLIGASVLAFAATAAAAGYSLLDEPREPLAPPPSAPAVSIAAPTPPPPAPPAQPEPSVTEPEAPSAAPQSSVAPGKRVVEKPLAGEDPTRVAEAVKALRKQGDPARAQQLLSQYLRENPRGALAEDALALSIEAAAARKDPRAADYARRYLARYPNGRFRAVAERALSR